MALFHLIEILGTFVQLLILLLGIEPSPFPEWIQSPLIILRFFNLDSASTLAAIDPFKSAEVREIVPARLPVDMRLQFLLLAVIVPIFFATVSVLLVSPKLWTMFYFMTMLSIYLMTGGAVPDLLPEGAAAVEIAAGDTYHDVVLISGGILGLFCLLGAAWWLASSALRQRKDGSYFLRLQSRIPKTVTVGAIRRKETKHFDTVGQLVRLAYVVLCIVAGLGCVGVIEMRFLSFLGRLGPVSWALSGVFFLLALGGIVYGVASCFEHGRRMLWTLAAKGTSTFLSILLLLLTFLFVPVTSNIVAILACVPGDSWDGTTCPAGYRLPDPSASLVPYSAFTSYAHATSANFTRKGDTRFCQPLDTLFTDASYNRTTCPSSDSAAAISKSSRLYSDRSVLCTDLFHTYFASAAAIVLVFGVVAIGVIQVYLTSSAIHALEEEYPIDATTAIGLTDEQVVQEKLTLSNTVAKIIYDGLLREYRHWRTFPQLPHRLLVIVVSKVYFGGGETSTTVVAMTLSVVLHLLMTAATLYIQPYNRRAENIVAVATMATVTFVAIVGLAGADRPSVVTEHVGLYVFAAILVVLAPIAALIVGILMTRRDQHEKAEKRATRIQAAINSAVDDAAADAAHVPQLCCVTGVGEKEIEKDERGYERGATVVNKIRSLFGGAAAAAGSGPARRHRSSVFGARMESDDDDDTTDDDGDETSPRFAPLRRDPELLDQSDDFSISNDSSNSSFFLTSSDDDDDDDDDDDVATEDQHQSSSSGRRHSLAPPAVPSLNSLLVDNDDEDDDDDGFLASGVLPPLRVIGRRRSHAGLPDGSHNLVLAAAPGTAAFSNNSRSSSSRSRNNNINQKERLRLQKRRKSGSNSSSSSAFVGPSSSAAASAFSGAGQQQQQQQMMMASSGSFGAVSREGSLLGFPTLRRMTSTGDAFRRDISFAGGHFDQHDAASAAAAARSSGEKVGGLRHALSFAAGLILNRQQVRSTIDAVPSRPGLQPSLSLGGAMLESPEQSGVSINSPAAAAAAAGTTPKHPQPLQEQNVLLPSATAAAADSPLSVKSPSGPLLRRLSSRFDRTIPFPASEVTTFLNEQEQREKKKKKKSSQQHQIVDVDVVHFKPFGANKSNQQQQQQQPSSPRRQRTVTITADDGAASSSSSSSAVVPTKTHRARFNFGAVARSCSSTDSDPLQLVPPAKRAIWRRRGETAARMIRYKNSNGALKRMMIPMEGIRFEVSSVNLSGDERQQQQMADVVDAACVSLPSVSQEDEKMHPSAVVAAEAAVSPTSSPLVMAEPEQDEKKQQQQQQHSRARNLWIFAINSTIDNVLLASLECYLGEVAEAEREELHERILAEQRERRKKKEAKRNNSNNKTKHHHRTSSTSSNKNSSTLHHGATNPLAALPRDEEDDDDEAVIATRTNSFTFTPTASNEQQPNPHLLLTVPDSGSGTLLPRHSSSGTTSINNKNNNKKKKITPTHAGLGHTGEIPSDVLLPDGGREPKPRMTLEKSLRAESFCAAASSPEEAAAVTSVSQQQQQQQQQQHPILAAEISGGGDDDHVGGRSDIPPPTTNSSALTDAASGVSGGMGSKSFRPLHVAVRASSSTSELEFRPLEAHPSVVIRSPLLFLGVEQQQQQQTHEPSSGDLSIIVGFQDQNSNHSTNSNSNGSPLGSTTLDKKALVERQQRGWRRAIFDLVLREREAQEAVKGSSHVDDVFDPDADYDEEEDEGAYEEEDPSGSGTHTESAGVHPQSSSLPTDSSMRHQMSDSSGSNSRIQQRRRRLRRNTMLELESNSIITNEEDDDDLGSSKISQLDASAILPPTLRRSHTRELLDIQRALAEPMMDNEVADKMKRRVRRIYTRHLQSVKLRQEATDYRVNRDAALALQIFFSVMGIALLVALYLGLIGAVQTQREEFSFFMPWGGMDVAIAKKQYGRDPQLAELALAGYTSWRSFTDGCCCVAFDNQTDVEALSVEKWLCENGKVKERARRTASGVNSLSSVRGLCETSFKNNCSVAVTAAPPFFVTLQGCYSNVTSAEKELW